MQSTSEKERKKTMKEPKTPKKEYTILYKLAEDKDQESYRTINGKFKDKQAALASLMSLTTEKVCTVTECVIFPTRRMSRGRPRKNSIN